MDQLPLPGCSEVERQDLHHSSLLEADKKRSAIASLWSSIASELPDAIEQLSPEANFFNIGGDSLNSISTMAKLREAGYNISVSDFINSKTLLDMVNKMTLDTSGDRQNYENYLNKYKFDRISEKYKEDVYRIVSDSYYNKSVIEKNMDPPVEKHEYLKLLDAIWLRRVNNPFSFVAKDINSGEVVGCGLMADIKDDPPLRLQSNYDYVIEFLEYLETPIIETLLLKGKILYGDMLATDVKLSPQENIELALAMELKAEDIARQNGYIGIFVTNSSPLTRQLAESVLNYKVLKNYQLNQYVASDGTMPFKRSDDRVTVTSAFKELQ